MQPIVTHTLEARNLVIEGMMAHRIDHSGNSAANITISDEEEFENYVKRLLSDVSLSSKGRKYKIKSPDTQVVSVALKALLQKDFTGLHDSAKRLLEHELLAQGKVEHLGVEILGGVLLQASIVDNGSRRFIICKAENSEFLHDKTFKRANGYPIKRRIFRSVRVQLNDDGEITEIMVYDSTPKGATYWWDGFLELENFWDDAYNTNRAFERIDGRVLAPIKKKYPADHMYLRNATIRYFRGNERFELDDFIDKVIGAYVPVDDDLDIEELKKKISELPSKFGFDVEFDLVPKEITARIKTVVHLTDSIELVIKKDIEIKHFIKSVKENGQKYIRIKTDEGYEAFLQPEAETK